MTSYTTQPIRLALLGCGNHSESAHARPLAHYRAQHPGSVELAAACDRDRARAERFCQQYGFVQAYSDLETMLQAERLDGIISVLPIEQIKKVGSRLLRHGVPCALEKPPGSSFEEAQALLEVAQQTQTPHYVSLNRRFSPFLNRALDWMRAVGPLNYVRGQMFRHDRHEAEFLWGTGVHLVDAMRHIGGDFATFEVQRLAAPSWSAPSFLLTVQFQSGAVGHLEILPSVGMVEERFELFGEDFRASVTTMGRDGEAVRCWRNGKLEVEEVASAETPLFLRDGSYEETCAFLRCLQEGTPLFPTLADVLPSLRVCQERGSRE